MVDRRKRLEGHFPVPARASRDPPLGHLSPLPPVRFRPPPYHRPLRGRAPGTGHPPCLGGRSWLSPARRDRGDAERFDGHRETRRRARRLLRPARTSVQFVGRRFVLVPFAPRNVASLP